MVARVPTHDCPISNLDLQWPRAQQGILCMVYAKQEGRGSKGGGERPAPGWIASRMWLGGDQDSPMSTSSWGWQVAGIQTSQHWAPGAVSLGPFLAYGRCWTNWPLRLSDLPLPIGSANFVEHLPALRPLPGFSLPGAHCTTLPTAVLTWCPTSCRSQPTHSHSLGEHFASLWPVMFVLAVPLWTGTKYPVHVCVHVA